MTVCCCISLLLAIFVEFLEVVGVSRKLKNERRSAQLLCEVFVQEFEIFVDVIDVGDLIYLRTIKLRLLKLPRHAVLFWIYRCIDFDTDRNLLQMARFFN